MNSGSQPITAESVRDMLENCMRTGNYKPTLERLRGRLRSKSQLAKNEIERLRTKGVALEILDHTGQYDEARDTIGEDGGRCVAYLEALTRDTVSDSDRIVDRQLLKQRVWLVIHVGLSCYRAGSYEEALKQFRVCEQVIGLPGLSTEAGMASRIHYCIGLVHRELFEYSLAKKHFTLSMSFAWRAVEGHGSVIATFGHVKTLALGLAWVHYIQGNLSLAIPLLLAAKDLLSDYGDPLISAYVDVIYWGVERSANARDSAVLARAIKGLEASRDVFIELKHNYYRVRVAHQLALAYYEKAKNQQVESAKLEAFDKATAYVNEMKQFAGGAQRFLCLALIVESRILRQRRNFAQAKDSADLAVSQSDLRFTKVEALLAQGEAAFDLGQTEKALRSFKDALCEGGDNPKICGACHLQMAKILADQHDLRRAEGHFRAWTALKGRVLNSYLLELEAEAKQILREKEGDFIVQWSSKNLNPRQLEKELHGFIVKWAQARSDNDEEAAALLQISKQTLYNWK
jgi:tetratricopeptide (TPR) repeat protein